MNPWKNLLERNLEFLQGLPLPDDYDLNWTMGGGTVLRQYYNHRRSKDVDIFLPNRQLLEYFNPKKNDQIYEEIEEYEMHSSEAIKLIFDEGQIDYICAQYLTDTDRIPLDFQGNTIDREPAVEIAAKKAVYRAEDYTLRDVFDFACVIDHEKDSVLNEMDAFLQNADELIPRIEKISKLYEDEIEDDILLLEDGKKYIEEGMGIVLDFVNDHLKPRMDALKEMEEDDDDEIEMGI